MARYIDADKVMEKISHITVTVMGGRSYGKTIFGQALNSYREEVLKRIKDAPTADVVPKREVDEIVRQWKEEANCWQNNYITELIANEQIRAEVSREIFEEIEELAKIYTFPVVKNGVVEIAKEPFWCIEPNGLAELKKKYAESENG